MIREKRRPGSWSVRIYEFLLHLYPPSFRKRFGAAMRHMFADAVSERRTAGLGALARLWLRTLGDLATNVPAAWAGRRTMLPIDIGPRSGVTTALSMWHDARLGVRMLARHPGFSCIAILTIALGIGANSAIFTVVNGVILRPLPYTRQNELVTVWTQFPSQNLPRFEMSAAEYLDYRRENSFFSELGAFATNTVTVTGGSEAQRALAGYASRTLFDALGVAPTLGRVFSEQEDQRGGARVTLLTHAYWVSHFGADSTVLGNRTVVIDGDSHTVIGVMPRDFTLPNATVDFLVPLGVNPSDRPGITNRSGHNLIVVGRLEPGATLTQAQRELASLLTRWEGEFAGVHPNDPIEHPLILIPLEEVIFGQVAPIILALGGAVVLVLLLACANVANLLLARGESRVREIGIRGALGAGRWRVARQLLIESGTLAVAGGLLGLAIGYVGTRWLTHLEPGNIPRLGEVSLDWRVVAFTLGVSLLTGLTFGALPAIHGARQDVTALLGGSSRGASAGKASRRTLTGLVVVQIAVAVTLVVGSGILIKNLWRLQHLDPGFDPTQRIAFDVNLSPRAYPDRAAAMRFYDAVLTDLRSIPGVRHVAAARGLPLRNRIGSEGFYIVGKSYQADAGAEPVDYQSVTPGYFRTMGVPVMAGREFLGTDAGSSPLVALLNESAAQAAFPNENPVGHAIRLPFARRDWPTVTIVGVVGDVRQSALDEDPRPELYLPHAQTPAGWAVNVIRSSAIVLQTNLATDIVSEAVRRAVRSVDPDVPIANLGPLDQVMSSAVARQRFVTVLLGSFAFVAITVAVIGVYGVMSFSVARRTKEIGIRVALGASPIQVVWSVLGEAITVAVAGGTIGLLAAWLGTRTLERLVYQVNVHDPSVFALAVLTLSTAAVAAAYLPARRAGRSDPVHCLGTDV